MLSYFYYSEILSPYQYGFRPERLIQEAIFDLIKFIYSGLNNKKLISTICLYVCKAFDWINHNLLLHKMRKIGFSDSTILWFRSYLTRTESVKIKESYSPTLNVRSGMGQGSILGPLIFIFYINDIVCSMGNLKINLYAADCILFRSGNNWSRMSLNVQSDLDSVSSWCSRKRLKSIYCDNIFEFKKCLKKIYCSFEP